MTDRKPQTKRKGKVGGTVDEFRNQYDPGYIVPKRIDAALKKLGNAWLVESEFKDLAEISQNQIAAFRDEYEDHVVVVKDAKTSRRAPRNIWCGTVEFAEKLRETLVSGRS